MYSDYICAAMYSTAKALQLPLPLPPILPPLHTAAATVTATAAAVTVTAATALRRRGEEAYKTVLDKRQCPQCTAVQSYDEVKEKRKLCPNCNVEYQRPRVWAAVRKRFLQRLHEFERSRGQQRAAGEAALRHQVCTASSAVYACSAVQCSVCAAE
jgi:ribosomal protein S27AE